jgi:hypothetical protein
MGNNDARHHPSQPECDSVGSSLHLPLKKAQSHCEGQKRKRVSADDDSLDDGEQVYATVVSVFLGVEFDLLT